MDHGLELQRLGQKHGSPQRDTLSHIYTVFCCIACPVSTHWCDLNPQPPSFNLTGQLVQVLVISNVRIFNHSIHPNPQPFPSRCPFPPLPFRRLLHRAVVPCTPPAASPSESPRRSSARRAAPPSRRRAALAAPGAEPGRTGGRAGCAFGLRTVKVWEGEVYCSMSGGGKGYFPM